MWLNIAIFIRNHQEVCGNIYRVGSNGNIIHSESFKFKINTIEKTPDAGNTKQVKTAGSLKYLKTFLKTLKMPLINCEIILILTWSKNCAISFSNRKTKFSITDTKRYVQVVNLST